MFFYSSAQEKEVKTQFSVPGAKSIYFYNNSDLRAIEFNEGVDASTFERNMHSYLNVGKDMHFGLKKTETDDIGFTHKRFGLYYKEVEIFGLEFILHEKAGMLVSANGRIAKSEDIMLDMHPLLTVDDAFKQAIDYVDAKPGDQEEQTPSLRISSKKNLYESGSFHLVYPFNITVSPSEQWLIEVDAHTGEIVNKRNLIYSCFSKTHPMPFTNGAGQTSYYGHQPIKTEFSVGIYRLRGQTNTGGLIETYDMANTYSGIPLDMTDNDNNFMDAYAQAGVTAQWASEKTYDYFRNKHNRNSFNNAGGVMRNQVHYGTNFLNAYYSWGSDMVRYGDGNGIIGPVVTLDIVGHEWTHGVTRYSAGLDYDDEPGALNESFSDIFGKSIEFDVKSNLATWLIGADMYGGVDAWRSMSNPNLYQCPDTYLGDFWQGLGAVHTNSGVQNYWYYLLCMGGAGTNDHGLTFNINAIGMSKAELIAYRNLNYYLTPFSKYIDSRFGSIMAAADLYGSGSIEQQMVEQAWDAVGVYDEPIIKDFMVQNITHSTASFYAVVNPNKSNTDVHFEYGTTLMYGTSTNSMNIGSGSFYSLVQIPISNLLPQTKYYVKAIATNQYGTTIDTTSFITPFACPSIVGLEADIINPNEAHLIWLDNMSQDYEVNYSSFDGVESASFYTGGSNEANLINLRPGMYYNAQIRSICLNPPLTSSPWSYISFATPPCESRGLNTQNEYIDLMNINGLNHISDNDNGYKNYTGLSFIPELYEDQSNVITFSAGPNSVNTRNKTWAIYIDVNRDGDYNDRGELVAMHVSSSMSDIVKTFNISNVNPGYSTMRVIVKYGKIVPGPCEVFANGEVEDYTVNLVGAGGVVSARTDKSALNQIDVDRKTTPQFFVFPNPVKDVLQITSSNKLQDDSFMNIYDLKGVCVFSGNYQSSLDVSALQSGVYIIRISNNMESPRFCRFIKK